MKKLLIIFFIISGLTSAQLKWRVASKQMPYPVSGAQVIYDIASKSDKIYILGGYSDSLQSAVSWIQEYDVVNDTWKMVDNGGGMLQAREQFGAAIWRNLVLYFGGTVAGSTDKYPIEQWDYKIVNNGASPIIRDKNFGRQFSTGHVIGDVFYIIGGEPSNSADTLDYIAAYNIPNRQIISDFKSPSASIISQRMTFTIGNYIYIFGGVMNGVTNSIQRFDTQNQKLDDLTEKLLEVRAAGAAVYNPLSQKGFIIGGYNEKDNSMSSVEQVEILPSGVLKITKSTPLTYARTNLMAVAYKNGYVVVFGGRTDRGHSGKTVPYVELLIEETSSAEGGGLEIPKEFSLQQNYPNPFNPTTNISFSISQRAYVSIDIYSVLGEHIVSLVSGDLEPGKYVKQWNAVDKFNNKVPSGIYFLKLRANNYIATKKMVFLK